MSARIGGAHAANCRMLCRFGDMFTEEQKNKIQEVVNLLSQLQIATIEQTNNETDILGLNK